MSLIGISEGTSIRILIATCNVVYFSMFRSFDEKFAFKCKIANVKTIASLLFVSTIQLFFPNCV